MNSEFASIQHSSCRVGLKQVVHVLRDARGISTVLSHMLPKGEQEVSAILVLEQKVDFIDEDEGVLALSSVLRNAVQGRVKDNQHTDWHKLFAEVKDAEVYCRGGFLHAAFLVAYRYDFTVWHFAFPPSC